MKTQAYVPKKAKIGLDFDGPITNNAQLKVDGFKELFNLDFNPHTFDKDFLIAEKFITEEQYRAVQKFVYEAAPFAWEEMQATPDALSTIARLQSAGHHVCIVTARSDQSLVNARNWAELNQLRLEFIGVGYGVSKAASLTSFDAFIDDDINKLIDPAVAKTVRYRFLWHTPENAKHHDASIVRVTSWREFYAKLQALRIID